MWKYYKNCHWSKWWLHNKLFIRLSLLLKKYKVIAIDLRKQQADPRAIQQINLTANLVRAWNKTIFFVIEEQKKLSWTFHEEL